MKWLDILAARMAPYRWSVLAASVLTYLVLAHGNAWAGTTAFCTAGNVTGGTGLPWEAPICKVVQSLTGPVAFGISLVAIFAAGAALVFGEELSGFARRILSIIIAVAFLIGGSALVTTLFPATF
jgi:type IV secretion system protein VirB2